MDNDAVSGTSHNPQFSSPLTFEVDVETLGVMEYLCQQRGYKSYSHLVREALQRYNIEQFAQQRYSRKQLSVRLSSDLRDRIAAAAKASDTSQAVILRAALQHFSTSAQGTVTEIQETKLMATKKTVSKKAVAQKAASPVVVVEPVAKVVETPVVVAKKAVVKKAVATKQTVSVKAVETVKEVVAKKAAVVEAAPQKAAPTKVAAKKVAPTKVAAKKTATPVVEVAAKKTATPVVEVAVKKVAVATKAAAKKVAPTKVAAKKTAAKKAVTKKTSDKK